MNMRHPLLTEAFGRIAFALTGARWASEMIAEARFERVWRNRVARHIANGGSVVTRQSAGMTSTILED